MRYHLLTCVIFIIGCKANCPSNGGPAIYTIAKSDTAKEGDVILDVAFTNMTISSFADACKNILKVQNETTFVLATDMNTVCETTKSCGYKLIKDTTEFSCTLILTPKRTQNYTVFFQYEAYNVSIKEDTHEETTTNENIEISPAPSVIFPNCMNNNQLSGARYRLTNDNGGYWEWEAELNTNSLWKKKAIDREKHSNFTLTLEVYIKYDGDSGTVLIAVNTTTINIEILDVDDNLPVFNITLGTVYTLNITDNDTSIVGTPLTTDPVIQGVDPDSDNTGIMFRIKEQDVDGLFNITQEGQIIVTRVIPRETPDGDVTEEYQLTIQVCQTDDTERCSDAVLKVYVDDIDNNLPTFLETNFSVSINEHALEGTPLLKLSAVDYDKGDNAIFNYKILSHDDVFSVNTDGYVTVSSSADLDREGTQDGKMVVMVGTETMTGNPGANNATITVTLVDINDHTPQFEQDVYTFQLNNFTVGEVIGMLNATDLDDGDNANVTYSIHTVINDCNSDPLPVQIGSDGDVILTAMPRCSEYSFLARACDNPTAGEKRCDVTSVTLKYQREASGPVLISQAYSVREQQPAGTIIGQLNCSGAANTKYTIDTPEFTVNNNGLLHTGAEFDREKNETYNFNVNVTSSQETCLLNITVDITDINDNSPVFINTPYIFKLTNTSITEGVIGQVEAHDLDENENGEVTYTMLNSSSGNGFSINETSGEIFVTSTANLNREVIELTVIARDNGSPPLKTLVSAYVVFLTIFIGTAASKILLVTSHSKGTSIYINTPMVKDDVEKQRENIERSISTVLGFTVTITEVVEVISRRRRSVDETMAASNVRSKVLITAGADVEHERLLSAVVTNYESIRALFTSPSSQSVDPGSSPDGLGAAEIALIAMAAVVLVGAVITIVIVNRQFNSHKRYKQLYENMTRHSSIYESQELKVTMDEETSDYNGSVKTQDLMETDIVRSQGLIANSANPVFQTSTLAATVIPGTDSNDHVSTINPLYQSADDFSTPTIVDTLVDDDPDQNTSVKEIMEKLEQLSDRLDQESSTMSLDMDQTVDDNDDVLPPPPEDYLHVDDDTNGDADVRKGVRVHTYENTVTFYSGTENEVTEDGNNNEQPIEVSTEAATQGDDTVVGGDDEEEEPNPDYNVKEVRFSTEVLDADENKLEPLKLGKEQSADNDNVENDDVSENQEMEMDGDDEDEGDGDDNCDGDDNIGAENNETVLGEAGWSEEQINSPVSQLAADFQEFYYNGGQDAMTYL